MPKNLNLTDELQKAEAQVKTNAAHRFPIVTKVAAGTYLRLVQDAINHNLVLSHAVEKTLTDYYEVKEFSSRLDATTQEVVKGLSSLWGVSVDDAIRMLVERTARTVLTDELNFRNELQAVAGKRKVK